MPSRRARLIACALTCFHTAVPVREVAIALAFRSVLLTRSLAVVVVRALAAHSLTCLLCARVRGVELVVRAECQCVHERALGARVSVLMPVRFCVVPVLVVEWVGWQCAGSGYQLMGWGAA